MNDLNWYIMHKDHDGVAVGGKQTHLIGLNPPPAENIKLMPSKSRERAGMNPSQLLINLQNHNFKQSQLAEQRQARSRRVSSDVN
jgi:hypothetical protein